MDVRICIGAVLLICFCSSVTSQDASLDATKTSINIQNVAVTSQKKDFTSVHVTYSSVDPVQASWTIDEGFTPFYFNSKTSQSSVKHLNGSITASIDLPTGLAFNVLRFHLVCEERSFVTHLALRVKPGMAPTFESVSQYFVYVPPASEIGISPSGEARFHAMINTTGTTFKFGMLQAEADLYSHAPNDVTSTYYDSNAAYSFLPENKSNVIRLNKVMDTNGEYHADVVIKSNKLFKEGAVISVLSACTNPNSIIHRMDIKQARYLHPGGTTTPIKKDTLGFIEEDYNLFVERNQHALLRCTVIGNPRPTITLHKLGKHGRSAPLDIPYHMTRLKYKSTAVFHVFNVDETKVGNYVCIATNGKRKVESPKHSINLISQQMIQESF